MKMLHHKRQQSGFTLLELAIVMVIIGILAAIAIANFTDLTTTAETRASQYSTNAVKTSWSAYYASNSAVPTVTQLAASLNQNGTAATAAATGVQITINGTTYTVATYSDAACSTATSAVGNSVQCVGAASS